MQKEIKGYNLKPPALVQFGGFKFVTMDKTCKKCGETKPLDCFYKTTKRENRQGNIIQYYGCYCKECDKIKTINYQKLNPEKIKKHRHAFYLKNKDKFKGHNKEYYQKNKVAVDAINKTYRLNHVEEIAAYHKSYNIKNKEERHKYRIGYYQKNKQEVLAKNAEYRANHKDQLSEYFKKYNIINKDKRREYRKTNSVRISENRRKYYVDHREESNKSRMEYYYVNHDKSKEWHRKYRLNNLDIIKERSRRYRSLWSMEQREKQRMNQRKHEYKNVTEMSPRYISGLLSRQTGVSRRIIKDNQKLIETYRVILRIKRLTKDYQNEKCN